MNLHRVLAACLLVGAPFLSSAPAAAAPYDDLLPGEWREISKNTIDDVDPCPTQDCAWSAVEGVSAVIDDWCSGALIQKWGTLGGLAVWGGGHNGYFGSEIYLFDLETQLWIRLTEPYDNGQSSVASDCNEQGVYPDGSACAAHNYDQIDYSPTTNELVIMNGTTDPECGGCSDGWVHRFDFDTSSWSLGPEVPAPPHATYGAMSAYDAKRDVFWFLGSYGAPPLTRVDLAGNAWTEHGDQLAPVGIDGAGVVDPDRDLFLQVDALETQKVYAFDLADPEATSVELTLTGDVEIVSNPKIGFDWDPIEHRAVGWDDGGDVYTLEGPSGDWKTEAWTWTRYVPATTNTTTPVRNQNGTYGRFRYVPSVNAFILVSSTGGPVWMYKMSDKPGTGGNTGSGGTTGNGGSGGSGTGGSGTGGSGANGAAVSNDDGGCGCRLVGTSGTSAGWILLALGFLRRFRSRVTTRA